MDILISKVFYKPYCYPLKACTCKSENHPPMCQQRAYFVIVYFYSIFKRKLHSNQLLQPALEEGIDSRFMSFRVLLLTNSASVTTAVVFTPRGQKKRNCSSISNIWKGMRFPAYRPK